MSAAARELGVSQPAISRQLQILEADLGAALFHRNRRGLTLTSAGNLYRHAVALGLDHIAAATASIRAQGAEHSVRLAANFGFAQQWLMPRFARLRAAHPQLSFRLMTSDDDAALDMAECDIAIRFGTGDWPGWHVVDLFAEEVFPICTPAYLEAHPELKHRLAPADLLQAHLLHLDSSNADWLDWNDWFRWHQVDSATPKPVMLYSTYPLVLQAILSSEGIGLGWRGLVDNLLAAGTLVQLLPGLKREQHGYFITWRKNHAQDKLLRKIADWMVGEAGR